MKFNYQSEKIKYIRTWEKLEAEYRRAGMNEASIKAMKAFDGKCSNRSGFSAFIFSTLMTVK